MQVYAWSNMLSAYSKESGLLQGAKDTFSGERPCELCCKIEQVKKSDSERGNDSPLSPLSAKLVQEFVATSEDVLVAPFSTTMPAPVFFGRLLQNGGAFTDVPVPPPQLLV